MCRVRQVEGCIGKKGAPYAAFFRGFTNVWGVSRPWATADRGVAALPTGSNLGVWHVPVGSVLKVEMVDEIRSLTDVKTVAY